MKKLLLYNPIFFIVTFSLMQGLMALFAIKDQILFALITLAINLIWGAIHMDWERVKNDIG